MLFCLGNELPLQVPITSQDVVGLSARNPAASTGDLTVTTGLGTTITGGNRGIYARNLGSGSLNVTTNGDVTGTGATSAGIDARNYGTDLSVTTDLGTTAVGRNYGIRARNLGSGA